VQGYTLRVDTRWSARLMYSNIYGGSRSAHVYFDLLRTTEGNDATLLFAIINNALLFVGQMSPQLHFDFENEFIDPAVRDKFREHRERFDGDLLLFSRGVSLLNQKLLLGIDNSAADVAPLTTIGDLALHGNDYMDSPDEFWESDPSDLRLMSEFAPTWDIHNPRQIYQLFVRSYLMLTKHLPASVAMTRIFDTAFGVGPRDLLFDELVLDDYIALVFGVFTAACDAVTNGKTCVINTQQFFELTTLPQSGLDAFFARRSGDKETFARELQVGVETAADLAAYLDSQVKALDMTVLRQRPLFHVSDGRCAVLDAQFVIELISTTLYWTIFDRLPPGRIREDFSSAWGGCFEAYVIDHLQHYYPAAAGVLRSCVHFPIGEVDAILDFADFVIIMEVKSGLMARDPRMSRDVELFRADLHKKFVDDAGVHQLAKAVTSLIAGDIETSRPSPRIYPLLVGDEPALQSFAANRYLDAEFTRKLGERPPSVAPLTVMSVDELEELLPYVSNGDLSWRDLIDSRFDANGVTPDPFHTALATARRRKNVRPRTNSFLSEAGEWIRSRIMERYRFEKMPAGPTTDV
jgi:hypothetical protein